MYSVIGEVREGGGWGKADGGSCKGVMEGMRCRNHGHGISLSLFHVRLGQYTPLLARKGPRT